MNAVFRIRRPVLRYGNRTFLDIDAAQIVLGFNLSRYWIDEKGCHVWRGAKQKGYAIVGTNRTGTYRAHRLTYIRDKGPIPLGFYPDHTCRNRACINSAHLELVTNAVNSQRGAKAKLDWDKVREIRRRAPLGETYRALATEFGVSNCAISNVVNHLRWKEAP
jgi:hypothetical protein